MSARNFQRLFTRELGKSPAHYVEEIRLEAVRHKLERATQSMEEIAAAFGRPPPIFHWSLVTGHSVITPCPSSTSSATPTPSLKRKILSAL